MKDSSKATIIRVILFVCILWSISMMYYVHIIKKDYVVLTNPDGPTVKE